MPIEVEKSITPDLVMQHPEKVFVFGDNLARRGRSGQQAIRDYPNTFGVPVRRAPSIDASSFFSDQEDERKALSESLRELFRLARTKTVVLPRAGLGTGLAQMAFYSPKLFALTCEILKEHFGFDQAPRPAEPGSEG